MYIGAHISSARGIHTTTEQAAHLEINAMQIFTKNKRQWFAGKLKEDEIDEYLENIKVYSIEKVFSHASYLLNLASSDKIILEKSLKSFLDEINRAEILNLEGVVFHAGTYSDSNIKEALDICSESINTLIEATKRYKTKLIIETTTGQSKSIGSSFEEIQQIIEKVETKNRVGVCIDTANIFEAGYNIKTERGYKKTIDEFDKIIGLKNLLIIHLNDSAKPLGSKIDKYANLGEGLIGKDFFKNILNDKRLRKIPFILETPGNLEGYEKDLQYIKSLVKGVRLMF